jgi:hypothetical protein
MQLLVMCLLFLLLPLLKPALGMWLPLTATLLLGRM